MARNLGIGRLRDQILEDLRSHQPLLDALDTSSLQGVDGPSDPVDQIHSAQTLQDTDHPVGLSIALARGAGSTTSSSATASVLVTLVVTARVGWRQTIDSNPDYGLSESYMDDILSIAGSRANIAFSIPYLEPNGLVGGAGSDDLSSGEGGQYSVAGRWRVTRRVVGQDGPRA